MTIATVPAVGQATDGQTLKFTNSDRFLYSLRRRVDAYFEKHGLSRRDSPKMYFKTATILAWFFGAYFLLLFAVHTWYLVVPLAIVMGLGLAAIGFNIQHDGGHKAYSKHQWVNKLMSMTLDLMGGSSYMWDWKHNSIHHTYTNITGHDDDIDLGFLARLSPHQRHFWFHRLQGVYLWLLYGFLAVKWHFFDDFYVAAVGKMGETKIPRPKGMDLAVFITGKVLFFTMAFVIPICLHSVLTVFAVYAIAAFTSGIVLSVVFQLAHCVEGAQFPMPVTNERGQQRMETGWAVHQVQTTVDFCRGNRVISWFVGGLNYQVEHHLFPKISHVHYREISKIVEEVCAEFELKYLSHNTFLSALASHYRWLQVMGRPIPVTA